MDYNYHILFEDCNLKIILKLPTKLSSYITFDNAGLSTFLMLSRQLIYGLSGSGIVQFLPGCDLALFKHELLIILVELVFFSQPKLFCQKHDVYKKLAQQIHAFISNSFIKDLFFKVAIMPFHPFFLTMCFFT